MTTTRFEDLPEEVSLEQAARFMAEHNPDKGDVEHFIKVLTAATLKGELETFRPLAFVAGGLSAILEDLTMLADQANMIPIQARSVYAIAEHVKRLKDFSEDYDKNEWGDE